MPKGMKIISELADSEWKQSLDEFRSADMDNSVQRLAAAVQRVALSHFTLAEHINTSAVPLGALGKLFSRQIGAVVTNTVTHGSGRTQAEGDTLAVYANTLSHSPSTVTPPCLLVTARYDGCESRSRYTDTHIIIHMSGFGRELVPSHFQSVKWTT